MNIIPKLWWQKAVAVGVLVTVLIADFYRADNLAHSVSDLAIEFVPRAIAIIVIWLLVLFVTKERKVSATSKQKE